ncbi:MAG: hypothetical protein Q9157_005184 [Trypethelium eluteriae]
MPSDSRSSSPDPIALSPTPSPSRRWARTVKTTPLAEGAANRYRLTPSKSIAFDTPASNGLSPWKIKVTVEAEPHSQESDVENVSPSQTTRVRSRSTKIPLKDVDGPSPGKPKRGRSKRASSPMTKQRKRNGTPVRKKQSRRQEDGNTEKIPADPTFQSPKATPLKPQLKQITTLSSILGGNDSDTLEEVTEVSPYPVNATKSQEALTMLVNEPSPSETNRYPRKPTLEARASTDSSTPRSQNSAAVPGRPPADHLPEYFYSNPNCARRADDGGNGVGSDVSDSVPGDQTMLQSEGFSFVSVPSVHEIQEHSKGPGQKDDNENHGAYGEAGYDNHEHGLKSMSALNESKNNLLPSEALEDIPEFSSLLATPPVLNNYATLRSDKFTNGRSKTPEMKTSHGMPSSPAVSMCGLLPPRATPIGNITPLSQPPALRQECPSREEVPTPEITNIVKTGNVLQGIVRDLPPLDQDFSTPDRNSITRSNIKDISSKSDNSVKSDQRADLSFPLELDKRLDRFGDTITSSPKCPAANVAERVTEEIHHQARHLLTPGDSDVSDVPDQPSLNDPVIYPTLPNLPHDTPATNPLHSQSHDASLPYSPISDATSSISEDLDELSRTQQLELEIQQDREAVRRQIEQASASQVITIDSDEEEDDDEEIDDNDADVAFEQDGSEDDESTTSQDDGDDTGFFFQRNMPAVFESPWDPRPGNSLYLSRHLKGRRSQHGTEAPRPTHSVTPEVSLNDVHSEDEPNETPEESSDNGSAISQNDGFTSSFEQSTQQACHVSNHEIHTVPLNDVASPDLRQSDRNRQPFQYSQSNGLDIQNSRSLSTVPESEEDASDLEADLWLPKSDVKSDVEEEITADEATSSEEEPACPCKDAVRLPEASSNINAGVLARLTAFFRSTLTWSAPSQPHIDPKLPEIQPEQPSQQPDQATRKPNQLPDQPEQTLPQSEEITSEAERFAPQLRSLQPKVSRREALLHKYGPLSRYEPWSLPHYRTLDRMHHRNLLDPEYFRYFPHNTQTNTSTKPEPHVLDPILQELVGHTIQRSGFIVTFSLADVHVIAAFLELLVEPEELSREEADKQATELVAGDTSEDGKVIGPAMLALRLFSLYAGDQMRREERLGLRPPPERS